MPVVTLFYLQFFSFLLMYNRKLEDSVLELTIKPLHKNILCLTVADTVAFTANVVKNTAFTS